ncbi:MAG: PhnD/SsuA/transferrin family substrate-binding protein [Bacteroidales bacterium]
MKTSTLIKGILIIVAVCALFAGCNNSNVTAGKFDETAFEPTTGTIASARDSMLTIHLAVSETYCKLTACSCIHDLAAREYEDLQDTLKSKYNIDLQISYFIEEYELNDSLVARKFDGVICKPWLAYMITPGTDIKYKRIADLLDPSGKQWLTGLFIVKNDSDVKTLKDINGKTLVAGQQDSYEKYHSPFAMLEKDGIEPKEITNKASCTECINTLSDNLAEVAIISDYALTASCAVDFAQPDDFRVIGKTEEIPLCSVILDMSKISEADALRLQNALLDISGEGAPKGLLSKGFVLPAKWAPIPFLKDKK